MVVDLVTGRPSSPTGAHRRRRRPRRDRRCRSNGRSCTDRPTSSRPCRRRARARLRVRRPPGSARPPPATGGAGHRGSAAATMSAPITTGSRSWPPRRRRRAASWWSRSGARRGARRRRPSSTNRSAHARYELGGLTITVARCPSTPPSSDRFTGRWTRELHPSALAWPHGAHTAENRRGRTSHEHPPLVFAGTAGFGEWHGEVWGAHLAWSGNHRVARRAAGRRAAVPAARRAAAPRRARARARRDATDTPEVVAVARRRRA